MTTPFKMHETLEKSKHRPSVLLSSRIALIGGCVRRAIDDRASNHLPAVKNFDQLAKISACDESLMKIGKNFDQFAKITCHQ